MQMLQLLGKKESFKETKCKSGAPSETGKYNVTHYLQWGECCVQQNLQSTELNVCFYRCLLFNATNRKESEPATAATGDTERDELEVVAARQKNGFEFERRKEEKDLKDAKVTRLSRLRRLSFAASVC